jgi:hypothetical protein
MTSDGNMGNGTWNMDAEHVLGWSVFSSDQVIANYLNEPAIVRDANKGHIIRRLALNFNRAVAMCALLSRWARAQTTLPEFVTLNGTVVSSVISHQISHHSSLFTAQLMLLINSSMMSG